MNCKRPVFDLGPHGSGPNQNRKDNTPCGLYCSQKKKVGFGSE